MIYIPAGVWERAEAANRRNRKSAAYCAGWAAYSDSASQGANPYPNDGGFNRAEWDKGWYAAFTLEDYERNRAGRR